jgi:uncharacterized protein (TIGR01777 family)
MRIFLTGGTGLIGRNLARGLIDRGDAVVVLSRDAARARRQPLLRGAELIEGDPVRPGPWTAALGGCDAVVHLAGYNVFAKRWSPEVKTLIRGSRVLGTQTLVSALAHASPRPPVLVAGSATGYYGPRGDEVLTEADGPGDDFLAHVCVEWEAAATAAEALGVRVARVRTGIVLDPDEGALATLTPVFKWVPGGAAPVGSGGGLVGTGGQWMSWIHRDDIVGLFRLALDSAAASGPINGTAPNPVRNFEFSRALARAVHRPFLPFGPPDFLLKAVIGEAAQVVTNGQRVLPAKAEALGYAFRFPTLDAALADLFGRASRGTADRAAGV